MPTPRNVAVNDMSRVWLMEDGAGPTRKPEYMGVWKVDGVSWDFGEETKIEIPADDQYQKFQEVASMPGTEGKPTTTMTARYAMNLSDMLRLALRRCYHDFQVHMGKCGSPQSFTQGWEKVAVYEHTKITNYATDPLGALGSDERAVVNEQIPISATAYYEVGRLSFAEICASSVVQEVIDVTFCDAKTCGECGIASNGCEKLFGLVKAVGASPGLGAQVIYSDDGGSTCGATAIDTLAANEDPNAFTCMGEDIVVVSLASLSHHYADRDEILLGTETWQEVTDGYVAAHGPRCIFCLKPGYAWAGGAGGYIYFLDNPASAVVVQDAGSATVQNINAIHGFDETHVVAVGASNALVYTTDGQTWTSVTGPEPGAALNAIWMASESVWWVGTATGNLYYTRNSGLTWVLKQFPGSGAGSVRDIVFVTTQVGYLAHSTAAPAGRILRTIDGGYQWYVLPEGTGSIPANDRINALAVCDDANLVIGGGLGDAAVDGIMVKAVA